MNSISIHETKLDSIAPCDRETTIERSQGAIDKQTSPSSGDKVYLYGDTTYTGTLIHPVERTSPPLWTVKLDRGGYEAVNLQHIKAIESKKLLEELEIPFSDAPEISSKPIRVLKTEELEERIRKLENTVKQLETENEIYQRQYKELEQENNNLKKDLNRAKQVIRRAKDASPVMRLSLKRVMRLAHHACMDVHRCLGGWILRMGNKARKFKRLWQVWDVISVDEFILSEIFPEDKLVDVNLIKPPKRRRRPTPPDKTTRPLMRPEDIMRNRIMPLVSSG